MNFVLRLLEIIKKTLGLNRTQKQIEPPVKEVGQLGTSWVVKDYLSLQSLAEQSSKNNSKCFDWHSCDFLRGWVAFESNSLERNRWLFVSCWLIGYQKGINKTPYKFRHIATHAVTVFRGGFWDEMNEEQGEVGRVYLWKPVFAVLVDLKAFYPEQDGALVSVVENLGRSLAYPEIATKNGVSVETWDIDELRFKSWKNALRRVATVRDDLGVVRL